MKISTICLRIYVLTLLCTTNTPNFKDNIEQVTVDDSDIAYLIAAINDYLKISWKKADMPLSSSSSPSAASRDWELKSTPNGVHYAIDGKIASSRQDADQAVE